MRERKRELNEVVLILKQSLVGLFLSQREFLQGFDSTHCLLKVIMLVHLRSHFFDLLFDFLIILDFRLNGNAFFNCGSHLNFRLLFGGLCFLCLLDHFIWQTR